MRKLYFLSLLCALGLSGTRAVAERPLANRTLSGVVFEDRNYSGGSGRPLAATPGAAGVSGARVEIFNAAGVFIATATTGAGGAWTASVPENATYTVRVVSGSVPSGRAFAAGSTATVPLAVPTYVNGDANRVGGENPTRSDAANAATIGATTLASLNTATTVAQTVSSVTVAMTDVPGLDFGFSFNVITNTNATGQGSLRQFIANANRLANTGLAIGATAEQDVSVFMIPDGAAHPGLRSSAQGLASQLTGGRAVIAVGATALPTLTDGGTVIDGTTQTTNVGDTNAGDASGNVAGANGGSVVGVGPDGVAATGDEATLPGTRAPEVEIVGPGGADLTGSNQIGLQLNGPDMRLTGLAIRGFSGRDVWVNPVVGRTVDNLVIDNNLFGSAATGLADPGSTNRSRRGLELAGAGSGTNITIENNVFAFTRMGGLTVDGPAYSNLTLTGNDMSNVGLSATTDGQGILLRGGYANVLVQHNYLTLPASANDQALEVRLSNNTSGTGTLLLSENTLSSASGAGIYVDENVAGAGGANPRAATVSGNLISNNRNQGMLLLAPQTRWLISRNSIFNNGTVAGGLGIDLGPTQGPSLNDSGDGDSGPNDLLNHPVFVTAIRRGSSLILSGYARPGTAIELFVAAADGTGFGEGQTYLTTLTEGSAADTDTGSGPYAGTINGRNQGADNTNRFVFTLPLPAGTTTGTVLTATGTVGGVTSEFAGNVIINVEPDAVDDVAFTPAGVAVAVNVTTNDTDSDGTIATTTVDLDTTTTGRQGTFTNATGTYTVNASGVVTFAPAVGYTGTAVLGYTVQDNLGASSAAATLTIYVGPLTANDVATTTSDVPAVIDVLNNDVDVDGIDAATVDLDPITPGIQASLVISGQGTAVADAAGVITFTPLINYAGPVSFQYVVEDLTASVSAAATVNLTITSAPPVAVNDVATTPANTPVSFSLTDNDYDPDGTVNLATVDLNPGLAGQQTSVTVAGQGTFATDNFGNVTFSPVNGYTGTATAQYTIRDNNGVLSLAAGTITVNIGPIANPDAATTGASVAVTVAVSANDVDANGLDLASIDLDPLTPGQQGSLTVSGQGTFAIDIAGNITFTPTGTFTGSTAVQYTIGDVTGAASAPTTLTVTSTNQAPTAVNDVLLTPANTTGSVSVVANDTDPDGGLDPASVDLDPVAAGTQTTRTVSGQGTFTVDAGGTVSFTPVANYTGSSAINYTVRDLTTAVSNVASITANVGPRAIAESKTTNYAVAVSVNVATNDIDADGLNVASVDLDPATAGQQTTFVVPNRGTFSVNNAGLVTFTPEVGVTSVGTAVVDYTIEDVLGSVSAPTTFTVTTTTNTPVAVANSLLLPPNTTSTVNIIGNDSDADGTLDPTTIDLDPTTPGQQTTRTVTGGTFNVDAAGVVTFVPDTDFTGATTLIQYTVRDNTGVLSNAANLTAYMGPVTQDDFTSTGPNVTVTFGLAGIPIITANDVDVNGLSISTLDLDLVIAGIQRTVVQPGVGTWTYNFTNGRLEFNPETAFRGLATIQYRLSDNRGGGLAAPSNVSTVSVLVGATAPLAADDIIRVEPTITVTHTATVNILTNDAATAPAVLRASTLDFDPLTPGQQVGTVSGGTASIVVAGQGTWTIGVNGAGVPTNGNLSFTPATGFTGTSVLTYTVDDNAAPAGTSNVATVRAYVGPIPTNDFASTAYNTPVSFDITSNDTDADGVNPATVDLDPGVAGVQTALTVAGGTFVVNASGQVTFTPSGSFVGTATARYTVRDINGARSSDDNLTTNGTIQVTVTTVPPVAVNDTLNTPPNATGLPTVANPVIAVLANDNDPDGSLNPATIDLNPAGVINSTYTDGYGNVWTASPTGQVTFQPALNSTRNVTRTYTVRDNTGTVSNTGGIRALVGPIARNDVGATASTNPVTVTVLGNDQDSDGLNNTTVDLDPLTPGQQTTRTTAAGTFTVLSGGGQTGRVRFTPAVGFTGTATTTYTVRDQDGALSNVATLTITVATNPVAQNDNVATPPNTAVTFSPLANDNAIDGSGLNVNTIDLDPATPGQQTTFTVAGEGTFALGPLLGQVTFTPAFNYTGTSATAQYTVDNNNGLTSNAATMTVRVGPLANADVAATVPNIVNTNNSVLFNVINNDVDVNGVALNRTDLDPVAPGRQTDLTTAQGRWRVDNIGRVRFNPAINFTGTATFQYVTQDQTNAPSSVGALTVNVGPITANDARTTGYNTPITFDATTNDVDVNGVAATTIDFDVSAPGQQTSRTIPNRGIFTLNPVSGLVTYTPTSTYIGVTSVTYLVRDVTGAPSSQATISITTTTSAPVAVNDTGFTPANTVGQVLILANDTDADGTLAVNSVDLNPAVSGRQNQLVVSGQGTFTVNNSGVLSFTPLAGFTGISQVTYTVRDNTGTLSNVATATVNVGPLTANETSSTSSNTAVSVNVLTNDVDVNGLAPATVDLDPLTPGQQTTRTIAGQGTYVVDAVGLVTFTPALNYTGASFVSYTVQDQTGATSTVGRWTVGIGPVAVNDVASIAYNAASVAVNVTTNDIDATGLNRASVDLDPATPGQQTSFVVAGQGTFSLTGTGGIVTFAPTGTFAGTTSVPYTLNDNQGNRSNVATFTVTTTTTAPVANANTVLTAPATPVTIDVTANDTDADGTIAANTVDLDPATPGQQTTVTIAGQGTFSASGGIVTYTPVTGFTGSSVVNYTVRDNAGALSNVTTLTARVGPLTSNDAVTILSNAVTTLTILSNDTDSEGIAAATVDLDPTTPLTQETTLTVFGGVFSVNAAGVLTFQPTTNFVGTSTVTYTVRDVNGAPSSVATVTVTVNTQPPVAVNDTRTTPSNTVLTFSAVANDTDPDGTVNPATVDFAPGTPGQQTSRSLPGQGVFSVDNAGNVTFTPALNYTGTAVTTYTVEDNTGTVSNAATITVNVGPIARNDAATVLYNTNAVLNVLANDTDVDGLQANSVDLDPSTPLTRETTRTVAGEGTFSVNASGVVTFVPVTNFTGVSAISYTVQDNLNATSNPAAITVTVTNAAPAAAADNVRTPSNTAVSFNVTTNDTDADGTIDAATVDLQPGVAGLQNTAVVSGQGTYAVSALGVVTFTPDLNYTGTSQLQYTVRDNVGATSNIAQITVRVGPLAGTDQRDTPSNTPIAFSIVANDSDLNGLAVGTIDLDPSTPLTREVTRTVAGEGTFSVNASGVVTFTPVLNFTGTSTIPYVIEDVTAARSNEAQLVVRVGPVVRNDVVSTPYTAATPIYPMTNDEDVDGLNAATLDLNPGVPGIQTTRTVAGQGTFGYNPLTGEVTFTPTGSYAGVTSITYVVQDNLGVLSNVGTITVNVTTAAPIALDNDAVTAPSTPVTVLVIDNDTDPDGSINQASVDLNPVAAGRQITRTVANEGTFTVDNSGNVTFTPVAGFTGTSQIPYLVRDNTGTASNVAMITVTVGPLLQNDVAVTPPNTAVSVNVLGNDADANGIAPATLDLDPATPGVRDVSVTITNEGTFTVDNAGNVTFTPVTGFTGSSSLPYVVQDVVGAPSTQATYLVHVGPLTANDTAESINGQPVVLTILGNDLDLDGINENTIDLDPSTPGIIDPSITVAGQGTFQANPDGTVTFTPAVGFYGGPVQTPYVVADIFGAPSNPSILAVTVAPYADVVTTMSGTTAAAGGTAVTYTVTTVNNGPAPAQNVVVTVQLVEYLRMMNRAPFTVAGATYDPDLGTLTYAPIATLAAHQTVSNSFTFRMPNTGYAFGTGSAVALPVVLGGVSDPQVANNDGSLPPATVETFGPLPVELVSFTAHGRGTDALLTWATAQEKNAAEFVVERSLDGGRTFAEAGRRAAHGTTSQAHAYELTDARIGRQAGTVYYRLRQLDLDGTATLSDVRAVTFTGKAQPNVLSLYPNPATTTATVDLTQTEAGAYTVRVYDATGRLVLTAPQAGGTTQLLDVAPLPVGTYLLRVSGAAGFSATQRFVKE